MAVITLPLLLATAFLPEANAEPIRLLGAGNPLKNPAYILVHQPPTMFEQILERLVAQSKLGLGKLFYAPKDSPKREALSWLVRDPRGREIRLGNRDRAVEYLAKYYLKQEAARGIPLLHLSGDARRVGEISQAESRSAVGSPLTRSRTPQSVAYEFPSSTILPEVVIGLYQGPRSIGLYASKGSFEADQEMFRAWSRSRTAGDAVLEHLEERGRLESISTTISAYSSQSGAVLDHLEKALPTLRSHFFPEVCARLLPEVEEGREVWTLFSLLKSKRFRVVYEVPLLTAK